MSLLKLLRHFSLVYYKLWFCICFATSNIAAQWRSLSRHHRIWRTFVHHNQTWSSNLLQGICSRKWPWHTGCHLDSKECRSSKSNTVEMIICRFFTIPLSKLIPTLILNLEKIINSYSLQVTLMFVKSGLVLSVRTVVKL